MTSITNIHLKRRDFLKLGMAGLVTTAVSSKFFKSNRRLSKKEESSPHRWAMVVDLNKCTGCEQCVFACHASNDTAPDMAWNRVMELGEVNGKEAFLPVQCMHCADAPCTHVCPVSATYQRADGIVMMDYDKCIGCRYCQEACPFGARVFNWEAYTGDNPTIPEWGEADIPRRPRGVIEKCTFCAQRIDRGLAAGLTPGVDEEATPACVVVCPVGARMFGDLNDENSVVSKALAENETFRLRESEGYEPRIYYIAVRPQTEEVTS